MYIDTMYKNVDIVEFQVVLFIIHVFILIIFLKFSSIRLKKKLSYSNRLCNGDEDERRRREMSEMTDLMRNITSCKLKFLVCYILTSVSFIKYKCTIWRL